MPSRLYTVTVDSHEPARLARFWAEVLGWRVSFEDDDEVAIEAPGARDEDAAVLFGRSDDVKSGKNRIHFDLAPDDQAAEVARLEALGATKVDIGQGDVSWVVMADPEGNEFCVLTPR